jgi:hypothetical protein
MKLGVNYSLKHSGEFFYKMTNEDDLNNYSLKKVLISSSKINLSIEESSKNN